MFKHVDPTTLSSVAFAILILIEAVSFWVLPDENEAGYAMRDTATNLFAAAGSQVVGYLIWGPVTLGAYLLTYHLTPLRIPHTKVTWLIAFVIFDFVYYSQHVAQHKVRLFWASHVTHHSSRRLNFSVAIRHTWSGIGTMPFVLPMIAMGFSPATVIAVDAANQLYQFWIHTERIGKFWAPIEWIMNTPSHHRVHHATNPQYLDRNFAGVFIIWDRLLGTFEPEVEKPVYGLTKNIDTYNQLRVQFHEYIAMCRDLIRLRGIKNRLGVLFLAPAWSYRAVATARPRGGRHRRDPGVMSTV